MTGDDGRPTPTECNMGLNRVRELTAVIFINNKMADKTCRLLEGKEASDFIAAMDTFIFDCDGK